MNMGDAMMNRPIIARRETVLRHRQRSGTSEERGNNRESFQGGHHHSPKRLHSPESTHENPSQGLLI
jgi:hypothetical protein